MWQKKGTGKAEPTAGSPWFNYPLKSGHFKQTVASGRIYAWKRLTAINFRRASASVIGLLLKPNFDGRCDDFLDGLFPGPSRAA